MNNLLIIGAGHYGMIVKEIAETLGYDKIDFLDDNSEKAVGRINEMAQFTNEYRNAVVAIGNAGIRLKLIAELEKAGCDIPILVHEKAYISKSAVIGKGSIIEPMAVVHTEARIGTGCLISAGAVINHNSIIDDGCHIDCGTVVGARAVVRSKTNTKYGEIITE